MRVVAVSDYEHPPGGSEALNRGCTCPVLDNAHGEGYMGTSEYVVAFDCPLHGETNE